MFRFFDLRDNPDHTKNILYLKNCLVWFDSIYELFQNEEEDSGNPDFDKNTNSIDYFRVCVCYFILIDIYNISLTHF